MLKGAAACAPDALRAALGNLLPGVDTSAPAAAAAAGPAGSSSATAAPAPGAGPGGAVPGADGGVWDPPQGKYARPGATRVRARLLAHCALYEGSSRAGSWITPTRSTVLCRAVRLELCIDCAQVFPGRGKGVYYPRMPCLRCGCPWWLGEDWDATCMR